MNAREPLIVGIERLSDKVKDPLKATTKAAMFDIYVCFHKPTVVVYLPDNTVAERRLEEGGLMIRPMERALVPTGCIFHIPPEWSIRLHPRSGTALKKGINLINCEGIVDEDYKFETFFVLMNNSTEDFFVGAEDRIGQLELVPVFDVVFKDIRYEVDSNRVGGMGSTG